MLMFVRHGHSEVNVAGVFANRGEGYPLSDTGRAQAAELADRLGDLQVDRVYSSPLLRARQTADVIAARTGAPVTVTAALTECDMGELEAPAIRRGGRCTPKSTTHGCTADGMSSRRAVKACWTCGTGSAR